MTVWSVDARTGDRRGEYAESSAEQVDQACRTAQATLRALDAAGPRGRAELLDAIAAELEAAGDALVAAADAETALGGPRLTGEVARSAGQFRLFARVLREGSFLDVRIDHADGSTTPPTPDLRRMNVPFGVVAVFAASNFPLAFSVCGGDTASALAAGCPVVVKAHPLHPETSEIALAALRAGARKAGLPEEVVHLVHGQEAGITLVNHPLVKAVGFTGSVPGGRYLHDVAKARPEPIPFYGELGSLNPLVITPGAAEARAAAIASGLAASATLGSGQFCTKPGLVLAPATEAGRALVEALAGHFTETGPQVLLGDGIRGGFLSGADARSSLPGVTVAATGKPGDDRQVTARLLTAPATLLADDKAAELLLEECFGPLTVVLTYEDEDELVATLSATPGNLTATLHSEPGEEELAARLVSVLRDRAGRLVFNGYPTGVAVAWAQQHGGPYPSATEPATTSVGTAAIFRFLRPVAYQDTPPALLPEALRDDNPLGVPRHVDGVLDVPR
ncbi:aldehyde dehydrogenase (NADP(+)) [Microtetraspora sp. NBRC 16547]|uniref:aldehyde dehydrogenase (NADP(+)) n=1 Tax=Microtetraspora sp. NBRC 16547 TaxID=3030993 RepID=UPI0024A542F9|nr:aldehyde dehydrogenase (NADP(+)) [Microtetraspora sp. NBRC 16547]GLW97998.1 aldehyde dehydrogenase [Microtetraspora sp. NBRC 16547]